MSREKKFYKAKELSEILDVNIMTIYSYIKAKKIIAIKAGRDFRIKREDFENFLKKFKHN